MLRTCMISSLFIVRKNEALGSTLGSPLFLVWFLYRTLQFQQVRQILKDRFSACAKLEVGLNQYESI